MLPLLAPLCCCSCSCSPRLGVSVNARAAGCASARFVPPAELASSRSSHLAAFLARTVTARGNIRHRGTSRSTTRRTGPRWATSARHCPAARVGRTLAALVRMRPSSGLPHALVLTVGLLFLAGARSRWLRCSPPRARARRRRRVVRRIGGGGGGCAAVASSIRGRTLGSGFQSSSRCWHWAAAAHGRHRRVKQKLFYPRRRHRLSSLSSARTRLRGRAAGVVLVAVLAGAARIAHSRRRPLARLWRSASPVLVATHTLVNLGVVTASCRRRAALPFLSFGALRS